MDIRLIVNEKPHNLQLRSDRRLIDILRDDLHLTGTKEGCSQGECGACTVILNNIPVCSCLVLACHLHDDDRIETIELEDPLIQRIKDAFVKEGSVQCGFCIPGFIMSLYGLFKEKQNPSDDEIKIGISGNLCRCTGYKKILEAARFVRKVLAESN